MYNTSFAENGTVLLGLIEGINDNTGGWFAGLLLIAIFILLLMSINADFRTSMLVSSFIITIISAGLWWMGLVSWSYTIIPGIVLIVSLFIKVWGEYGA